MYLPGASLVKRKWPSGPRVNSVGGFFRSAISIESLAPDTGEPLVRTTPYISANLPRSMGEHCAEQNAAESTSHAITSRFIRAHILYLPRSSSFRPSSHLRSSSCDTRSAEALACLEALRTSSAT